MQLALRTCLTSPQFSMTSFYQLLYPSRSQSSCLMKNQGLRWGYFLITHYSPLTHLTPSWSREARRGNLVGEFGTNHPTRVRKTGRSSLNNFRKSLYYMPRFLGKTLISSTSWKGQNQMISGGWGNILTEVHDGQLRGDTQLDLLFMKKEVTALAVMAMKQLSSKSSEEWGRKHQSTNLRLQVSRPQPVQRTLSGVPWNVAWKGKFRQAGSSLRTVSSKGKNSPFWYLGKQTGVSGIRLG